jgi:hypothetical protein
VLVNVSVGVGVSVIVGVMVTVGVGVAVQTGGRETTMGVSVGKGVGVALGSRRLDPPARKKTTKRMITASTARIPKRGIDFLSGDKSCSIGA